MTTFKDLDQRLCMSTNNEYPLMGYPLRNKYMLMVFNLEFFDVPSLCQLPRIK